MNIHEYANALDSQEDQPYLDIPNDLIKQAKNDGVVIVYGASDDLVEFRGAIHDELDGYDGGEFFITADGLDQGNQCEEGDKCPNYRPAPEEKRVSLKAVWCGVPSGDRFISWTFEFPVQHATFNIMEDGEIYCVGIVFSMDDVRAAIRAKGGAA